MMPFWLWLLAGFFVSESSMVKVPFLEIAMTLVFLTVPLGLGLLIRRFYPKIAQYVTDKIVKPLCFIVLIFSFGVSSVSLLVVVSFFFNYQIEKLISVVGRRCVNRIILSHLNLINQIDKIN